MNISNIILKAQNKTGFSAALLASIATHESVNATKEHDVAEAAYAIRFEPDFFKKYIVPLQSSEKLTQTEAIARATSWGYCQIMGQVARELGYKEQFLSSLIKPLDNFMCCGLLLRRIYKQLYKAPYILNSELSSAQLNDMLLRYNGGGNPNYPKIVLEILESKEYLKFFPL
jgi:hypothetical protein